VRKKLFKRKGLLLKELKRKKIEIEQRGLWEYPVWTPIGGEETREVGAASEGRGSHRVKKEERKKKKAWRKTSDMKKKTEGSDFCGAG